MTARLAAYVIAAMIAALSGALYPMLRGFVSPELLFFSTSGNAVITVVTGGAGTLVGALYGSVLLTVLKSVIGSYTEHHLIVIGLLFMGAVVFLPKGLMGIVRPAIERMAGAGAQAMTAPILEIRDLSVSFGGLRAVDDVSFEVVAQIASPP